MNRTKIVDAILKLGSFNHDVLLLSALKRLSDTNLLAFAIEMGIDTDAVLAVRS